MYLKQLDIHGFKSFAEKIGLSFDKGITAVVGPNGSGKSNISDSIRWVLGEQSIRSLRGNKMEDVIFAGSDKKKALGFAEVSLCIDNSDKKIPVDFTEINVMRRMYRSGESEYFINKVQCRLKDIYEVFMDTGIGKDGYSIIGQGRIDEILSNKSEDRRLVFEEAAGIVKYKTRKQEAEKKLESTKQNILRVQDILQEIEGQLEPLKQQSELARKYIVIADELKSIEINIFINNIDKYRDRLNSIRKEVTGIQELLSSKIDQTAKLESTHSDLKKELAELELYTNDESEKLHKLENDKQKFDGEFNLINERISNLTENLKMLKMQLEEITQDYEKTKDSMGESTIQLEEYSNEINKCKDELAALIKQFEEKYKSSDDFEEILNSKQQELIENINIISEFKSKISSSHSFIESIEKRQKQLHEDINKQNEQHSEKMVLSESINKQFEECAEKIQSYTNILNQLKNDKIDCEKSISANENKISEIKSEKDKIFSRLKVLEELEKEHGGYSKPVKTILQEENSIKKLATGFHGVVGELIQVPDEYITAVEVALGNSIQSVVTEDEEDAKLLIDYLKKNKLGRATFLPISSVKPRYFNDKERKLFNIEGFCGIAADLINYDNKFSNVINNILGRVAIVKDIDTSIKLAKLSGYEFRIVTLEGEVINAGGSITGGSLNHSSNSVLSRKNEINNLKTVYKNKKEEFEKLLVELGEKKQKLSNITIEISVKTDIIHSLQIEQNNIKNKLSNNQSSIEMIKERLKVYEKEIESLEKDRDEAERNIENDNKKMNEVEDKKSYLENEITKLQLDIKELKELSDKDNEQITEYKVKIASLEQGRESVKGQIENLNFKLSELEKRIETNRQQTETSKNDKDMYIQKLAEKKDEIVGIESLISQKNSELEDNDRKKTKIQNELELIEVKLKEYQKEISVLQSDLHKNEMQQAKNELELENLEFKLLETYDINYSKALEYKDEELNYNWAFKRCDELKGEIREMGVVNVNAIDEYSKLSERYRFLSSQIEDLVNAKESLIKIIVEITENMKQQFITEFYKINESFCEVFKELFGGGHAELIISDETNVLESGIEIIARPPGKKMQSLSLLSGGERALTAISLLFGILKLKPAPFCILDEIDAALDDANVDRYSKFLRQFSDTTQFIIITHRKGTMEAADSLYGVSMEDNGISKLISVRLEEKVS